MLKFILAYPFNHRPYAHIQIHLMLKFITHSFSPVMCLSYSNTSHVKVYQEAAEKSAEMELPFKYISC